MHAPDPGAALDEVDGLWRALLAGKEAEYLEGWLGLQCRMIAGVRHGVLVLGPADLGPFAPKAAWPSGEAAVRHLAELAENALAERRPLILRLAGSLGLACPIQVDGHLHGVAALEIAPRPQEQAEQALRQLQWGIAWIELHLRREALQEGHGVQERLMTALDLIVTVLNEERFEAACRALVTELAMRLNCDRVSLGVVRMGHARVLAVSHSAQFGKRMNLTHAVGSAMDEAIDQKSLIVHPANAQAEVLVTRDHERLAHDHGSESILTVPFSGAAHDFTGAVTFERPGHLPFDPAAVEMCQSVVAVLSRLLEAKRLNDRPLGVRTLDALREQTRKLLGPRHVTRKVVAAAVVLLALFFAFATGEYRVTAPSTLEGAVRRTLAAPFDGYISTADRRAGDVVRAGTLLATLDDRDLRLERLRWASQYAQYAKQFQEAVAGHDRAKAQIAQAQADQARAQMALAEEQLSRASLRAPFDGIVAKGDLSQSLGAAVRRGDTLFELTPLDAYRLVIQVDEGEITEVRAGQKGTLVLASISDEPFELTVSSVTPVTTSREGRNYFRVEAGLDRVSDRLRPGMEGVAKIRIEERKLIWIWTHRMMNWLRLFFWTWWP
jgi:RND family efflux transporter MFP subunit